MSHELAAHEVKMGCYCPEKHRRRNLNEFTSECTYCGRKWDGDEDIARARRAARLKRHPTYLTRPEIRETMKKGKKNGKAVWLEYIDRNDELSERLITPLKIDRSAVRAHCHARDAERLFIYDRIHACRVVDRQ